MKTLFVSKYLKDQNILHRSVLRINGSVPVDTRNSILDKFNSNKVKELAITKPIALIGGVKYLENGVAIDVQFIGDYTEEEKSYIKSRINIQ